MLAPGAACRVNALVLAAALASTMSAVARTGEAPWQPTAAAGTGQQDWFGVSDVGVNDQREAEEQREEAVGANYYNYDFGDYTDDYIDNTGAYKGVKLDKRNGGSHLTLSVVDASTAAADPAATTSDDDSDDAAMSAASDHNDLSSAVPAAAEIGAARFRRLQLSMKGDKLPQRHRQDERLELEQLGEVENTRQIFDESSAVEESVISRHRRHVIGTLVSLSVVLVACAAGYAAWSRRKELASWFSSLSSTDCDEPAVASGNKRNAAGGADRTASLLAI